MTEITVTPMAILKVLQSTFALMFLAGFICWIMFNKVPDRVRWTTIISFLIAVSSGLIRDCIECKHAHAAIFQKLPAEWIEFSESLAEVKQRDLRHEAIRRFVGSNPPRLTAENYEALLGTELWGDSLTPVHRSFRKATCFLDDLVILDFAEGQK